MKVFISYAKEDEDTAKKLYNDLKNAGIKPWMVSEDLLPGQNRKVIIRQAIKDSSYFLALLSPKSISKRGFVQKELKIALDILDKLPQTEIFIIPVRLDDCEPVDERLEDVDPVDLFVSYENGLNQILRVLKSGNEESEECSPHQDTPFSFDSSQKIKILFLTANPMDDARLRLDQEIRSIDQALRNAQFRTDLTSYSTALSG